MKFTLITITTLLFAPLGALHSAEKVSIVFYVAADGADINSGKDQQPFATLEHPRDAIRELKKPSGNLPSRGRDRVSARRSIYPRKTSFALAPEDSGTRDAPVVYTAFSGEIPPLVGGIVLDAALFPEAEQAGSQAIQKAYTTNKSLYWWRIRTLDLNAIDRGGLATSHPPPERK